jgi:hypothetical protein
MITGIILFFILGSEFFINYRFDSAGKRRRQANDAVHLFDSSAVVFGTVILFGAVGEILAEKVWQPEPWCSGHHVSWRHRGSNRCVLLGERRGKPDSARVADFTLLAGLSRPCSAD